jgi:3-methyladenine DNA glycosylase AlkC
MAEPLKDFFSPALAERLARSLRPHHGRLSVAAFVQDATADLDELELLDRARQFARAMAAHLPAAYPDALAVILRSLGPPHASDELEGAGMAPFFYLPHTLFVAERGLDHVALSLDAQRELTRRFTAEFSIRAFLVAAPAETLAAMRRWAIDPDPHVRRLVSEGTRLRLPWGTRVPWLDRDPGPALELVELLKDDPAPVVRRSVANHLNDLGRLHPARLVAIAGAWLDGASDERRALIEHALRGAVKRGEAAALALLGYGRAPAVEVSAARCEPARVAIGETVAISFTLRSTARRAQDLLVDLRVHFVKARGATSPKVFKLTRLSLPPGGEAELDKRVSLAVHTTRTPQPGTHRVELLINGAPRPLATFEVVAARSRR